MWICLLSTLEKSLKGIEQQIVNSSLVIINPSIFAIYFFIDITHELTAMPNTLLKL